MEAASGSPKDKGDVQKSNESVHRGVLDSDGQVVKACSQAYLTILLLEFLRAKAFPLVKLGRRHDWKAQIHRFLFLETEIPRLFENPDLFPSPASRAKFAAIIALDANLQFIQAVKDLLLRESVREMRQFSRDSYTRPYYLKGSKGWENFLLNLAPGTPIPEKRTVTTPKSAFQVLPAVGMRIIADNRQDERSLERWILETPTPIEVQRASTTKLINLDLEDDEKPNAKRILSQAAEPFNMRPNPFNERLRVRLDIPIQEPEPIEEYTAFLGRLDFAPLPPNDPGTAMTGPFAFPIIAVRSWHRPTKPWELRYRYLDDEATSPVY